MAKKSWRKKFLATVGVRIGYWALTLLYRSLRSRIHHHNHLLAPLKQDQSIIVSVWHRDLLGIGEALRHHNYHTLISRHNDGDILAFVANRWGWKPIRGSSNKYGVEAYRDLLRTLKQAGQVVVITPDGPRGPAETPKPGILRAAQKTDTMIIPATIQYDRCWQLNTWDKFRIAKPFARLDLYLGEGITLESNESLETAAQRLVQAHRNHALRALSAPDQVRGKVD